MGCQKLDYVFVAFIHDACDFHIYVLLCFFREFTDKCWLSAGIAKNALAQSHVAEFVAHTKVNNHSPYDFCCTGNIV